MLTAVCAVAVAALFALGFWQVGRMGWKAGLIAQAERAATLPPAPLAEVMGADDPEFRRAVTVCPGLATAPFVQLQSIEGGRPGVRLISACTPPGEARPWLVDRGFVADAVTARPPATASTLPLGMLVQLRRAPEPNRFSPPPGSGRFYARDGEAMARALGVGSPQPFVLFALTSTNPDLLALEPSAPPAAFSNNHLGYALTWFGLAVALVGFWAVIVRRRMRGVG